MIIYREVAVLKNKIAETRQYGKTIGLVPTMGALHSGHISLISASIKKCDITVCSIFVNPTQFNDPTDFEKYPDNISNDILMLENSGCDILFLPSVTEIYPAGTDRQNHYDIGELEYIFEGKYRPGHFQGVCQVVHRLLDIVDPHYLFMGQKDYQQCQVIMRLVQIIKCRAEVIIVKTVRENSGLAMSSRNLRLTEEQKKSAAGIFKMLMYIKNNFTTIPIPQINIYATDYLLTNGFQKVDYVAIADADTLHPVNDLSEAARLVALAAAFIGEVRLIDNMVLTD
ncbi:pantoate--beta-alanine ligase [Segetibacter koreensis]|uniref:pantoate--beta-alanine ligase n=1 Tax=Segetibacter koreensis TaxID=398037 RepID=UPI00035D3ABD|nr:pantoate--beta-alanine ligase [Segetibacter koreensis]